MSLDNFSEDGDNVSQRLATSTALAVSILHKFINVIGSAATASNLPTTSIRLVHQFRGNDGTQSSQHAKLPLGPLPVQPGRVCQRGWARIHHSQQDRAGNVGVTLALHLPQSHCSQPQVSARPSPFPTVEHRTHPWSLQDWPSHPRGRW